MSDLFASGGNAGEQGPLADRMRPQTLDDVIGQDHIVGPGRLLRRAIQADRLSSLIFYGPPGTGKTSLARVIANTTRSTFESLNAVLTGIKDIREVIDRSDERRRLYGKRTILFVDEVHRWNKAQQDALLPWVENGTVILIGATTENPFFEVNRALVSRSRIFQLKPIKLEDLRKVAERTLTDRERGYGKWKVVFEEGALEHLVEVSGGDARSLLNALELSIETSVQDGKAVLQWPPPPGAEIKVSFEAAEESIQRRAVLYDRDGDYHFDTISAFIKSVRGSDPDAALYWLAKMVRAGEDPSFIFRRMIILAMEDVGLADPNAIREVMACAEAFDRIGFPEGNFALSMACLYLATAPKSNTTLAFFDALAEVDKEDAEVPNHLRDASRDAEGFGHGEGYIYPHAYRDHWAAQQYLPTALKGKTFYAPSTVGYEGHIRDEVQKKREVQAAVILGDMSENAANAAEGEILTWSAASKGREGWFKRLESGRSSLLLSDRDAILGASEISRHHRILIAQANDGLLLWESLRRAPEGLCAALVDTEAAKEALLRFAAALDEAEQPLIKVQTPGNMPGNLPDPKEAEENFSTSQFDHIFAREPWRRVAPGPGAFSAFALQAKKLLAPKGTIVLLQSPPLLGERISRILSEETIAQGSAKKTAPVPASLVKKLKKAEESFFNTLGDDAARWNWDAALLEKSFTEAGFKTSVTLIEQKEERLLTAKDLQAWFDPARSSWGSSIFQALGEKDFYTLRDALQERVKEGPIAWQWKSVLMSASAARE
ncbi:AAA family ATPase [Leadbettera azotonutricia]|uniref:Replication-associated recombination protein A n=1 Tax=Leadbettera azotonutricia (strain ATCC BAA-888 / DSM 13862 / ZAS-9) TaxID=545695 RepID=F5YDI0_LEAAZ|nr:AAA family ATPase [Leadbettera azotonutricia]AEF83517.1 ATPase [Leadbettera azotonutricia ZAS-9]